MRQCSRRHPQTKRRDVQAANNPVTDNVLGFYTEDSVLAGIRPYMTIRPRNILLVRQVQRKCSGHLPLYR